MIKEIFHTLSHSHEHHGGFFDEVILHGVIETAKIIPFLFVAYLIMELIEHKASDRVRQFLTKSGRLGPLVGGGLGALPQCAFSAVASNLYAGRIISMGTLVAVFLSTSDEMLPLLIGSGASLSRIAMILGYKLAVGITVGFLIDLYIGLVKGRRQTISVDKLSTLIHTVQISVFILITTLAVGTAVYFIGSDALAAVVGKLPGISHLAAAFIGIIPGCATSVALTSLALDGVITDGVMLAGLFSGAGVGILVLAKVNKCWRENLVIMTVVVEVGFIFGLLYDILGIGALIA